MSVMLNIFIYATSTVFMFCPSLPCVLLKINTQVRVLSSSPYSISLRMTMADIRFLSVCTMITSYSEYCKEALGHLFWGRFILVLHHSKNVEFSRETPKYYLFPSCNSAEMHY